MPRTAICETTRTDVNEAEDIDPSISCTRCDAVCCRLPVLVMPDDDVPRHMVARDAYGMEVMARDEEGWCVAIDHRHMHCGIYERRPGICRTFAMGGAGCRDERAAYREQIARGIPLTVVEGFD